MADAIPPPGMKYCSGCGQTKPLDEFSRDRRHKDGLYFRCRECKNEAQRTRPGRRTYQQSPLGRAAQARYRAKRAAGVLEGGRARVRRTQEHLNQIKLERGCIDCGYRKYLVALDFDHRDPSQKLRPVSGLLNSAWEVIQEEIDKCDVRCANCHRIRTHANQHAQRRQPPDDQGVLPF